MSTNRLNYCQFLLATHTNYTLTYFSKHVTGQSHDSINRYLRRDKMTSRLIWEHAKGDVVYSSKGCLIFDDSVLDKNYSNRIEMVRRQYSGNAHGLIKGIGMVNCVYVNHETEQSWVIDYRIFDPESDGKTKLDHVREMLIAATVTKGVTYNRVLFDSWYATKNLMLLVESLGKIYYCPIHCNRLVDDSQGLLTYRRVDSLIWDAVDEHHGKQIKINGFPKDHKVKLFRVVASNSRTDWVVTNDSGAITTKDTQKACALRWKIEQLHRELKQLTGIEKCQCRKARIQRNHIACAVLVWIHLKKLALRAETTIYQLKEAMLSDYLRKELRSPSMPMTSA